MRRALTATLLAAAFASGCASSRAVANVASPRPAAAASPPADVGHSSGNFNLAHPFNRRPDWITASWAQDHPVLFVGVVVPAAVATAVLARTTALGP